MMSNNAAELLVGFLRGKSALTLTEEQRCEIVSNEGPTAELLRALGDRSSRCFDVNHRALMMQELGDEAVWRGTKLHSRIVAGEIADVERDIQGLRFVAERFPDELSLPRIVLHVVQADRYVSCDEWERAKSELSKLRKLFDSCAIWMFSRDAVTSALLCCGHIAEELAEYQFAVRAYETVVQISMHVTAHHIPSAAAGLLKLGEVYCRTGEIGHAKKLLDLAERLLADHPEDATEFLRLQVRDALGFFEACYGSPSKAMELTEGVAERLAETEGRSSRYVGVSLSVRANALFVSERREEAIAVIRESIAVMREACADRKAGDAVELNLAYYLCCEGRVEEAFEIGSRLEEYPWAKGRCFFIAGLAFYTVGNWEKSLEFFAEYRAVLKDEARESSYSYSAVEYYESLVYEQQDRTADSRAKRESAMSKLPEGNRLRRAMAKGEALNVAAF